MSQRDCSLFKLCWFQCGFTVTIVFGSGSCCFTPPAASPIDTVEVESVLCSKENQPSIWQQRWGVTPWPSTSLQVKLQHFGLKVIVYASQEVFNVLVHPSWTNNHRNSRNALGKLLLLLEIISVNYFYRGEGVRWWEPRWNMVQPPHSSHFTVWLVWQDLLFCKAITELWRYFNYDS